MQAAWKKYFEGIVEQLDFNFEYSKNSYFEATKLNPYQAKYYNKLGNIYYLLYDFNSSIDALTRGLNVSNFSNRKDQYIELELLLNLGKSYNAMLDKDNALSSYTNLLVNAINLNEEKYEWLAVYNISLIEASVGNYNSSIDYLKYALKFATKMRNREYIANSLNTLSSIQYKYGDYENGKKNALKAIKFAKKINNLGLIANASLNTCLNYDYLYKDELAEIYCNRALKINEVGGRIIKRPEYYLNNGFIYSFVSKFRDYNLSLNSYNIAYNLSKEFDLLLLEEKALLGISQQETMLNKTDDALESLNRAIKLQKKLDLSDRICNDSSFGQIYWKKDEYKDAINYYKKAIILALKENNNLILSSSASHLATIYYEIKNYDEALKYSRLAMEANEKVYRFDHHYIKYQEGWNKEIINKLKNKE